MVWKSYGFYTLPTRGTWYPKQPLFDGCFNWMIPNLNMGNGCLLGGDLQKLADF